jgi:hypothetical protein
MSHLLITSSTCLLSPLLINPSSSLYKLCEKKLYSEWFVDAFGNMKPFFPEFDDLTVRKLIIDRVCWPYLYKKKRYISCLLVYILQQLSLMSLAICSR